jgi:Xaa-Pro dipeptidase
MTFEPSSRNGGASGDDDRELGRGDFSEQFAPPPFSPAEYARRDALAQAHCERHGVEGILFVDPEDVFYLTNFQTCGHYIKPQYLILARGELQYFCRYGELTNVWARGRPFPLSYYDELDLLDARLADILSAAGLKRVGINLSSRYFSAALCDGLRSRGVAVVDTGQSFAALRAAKSQEEIAFIEAASGFTDAGLLAGLEKAPSVKRDYEIAGAVVGEMVRAGSEYPPLLPFVNVGRQTSLWHNSWSGEPVGNGDVIFMEVTGCSGRYIAPASRSAVKGALVAELRERFELCVASLEAAEAGLRAGITCEQAFHLIAKPFVDRGIEIFAKVGYAVGLAFVPNWVETDAYNLLPGNHTVLPENVALHIPRTIRMVGEQTTIISDTFLTTATGCRRLSRLPRELVLV